MSLDVCFWKRGSGESQNLYNAATEGEDSGFSPSAEVRAFREEVIARWPDLKGCVEPLESDPLTGERFDISRYILITIPLKLSGRYQSIVELALSHGLTGYDPQTTEDIA